MSDHDPFSKQLAEAQQKVQQSQGERRHQFEELSWFQAFNAPVAHARLSQLQRQRDALLREIAALGVDIKNGKAVVRQLEPDASLGFDPRRWFSSERAAAKERLAAAQATVDAASAKLSALSSEAAELGSKVSTLQVDLGRHRAFDSLQAEAAIRTIDRQLELAKFEVDRLSALKSDVDDQLKGPLADLQATRQEEASLLRRINRAEMLDRRMSEAAGDTADDRRARAGIHQQCADEFQERSPGKVANSLRSKLGPVQRRLLKQQAGIDLIVARATRVVRSVVIDGNNMCYQNRKFIGLSALEALVPRMCERYKTIIVFDSGIRGMLRMRDRDIQARFGSAAEVHVVATSAKADETALAIAEADQTMYVLSNDRFDDFAGRRAVADRRIIRHEIVNDAVHVHELDLSVKFGATLTAV
jgi:hypothetical protein